MKTKLSSIIIISLSFLFFIYIYIYITDNNILTSKGEEVMGEKSKSLYNNQFQVGFGLRADDGLFSETSYTSTLNKFTGRFKIQNEGPDGYQYGILLFLDYKQIDFNFVDKPILDQNNMKLINLGANEEKEILFNVNIPDGEHTLLAILLWEPNTPNEEGMILNPIMIYKKLNVVIKNHKTFKNSNIEKIKNHKKVKSKVLQEIDLIKNKNDIALDELKPWSYDSFVTTNNKIPFWIGVSNEYQEKEFAVIAVLNGKQVPLITDNKESLLKIGKIDKNQQFIFPVEINTPTEKINNFIVFLIDNPFKNHKNTEEELTIFSSTKVTLVQKGVK